MYNVYMYLAMNINKKIIIHHVYEAHIWKCLRKTNIEKIFEQKTALAETFADRLQ